MSCRARYRRWFFAAVAAFACSSGWAADFIVTNTLDDGDVIPGDGKCQALGIDDLAHACTLRAAIMEANALGGSSNIALPEGSYALTVIGINEDNAYTGDLDIRADITIVNGTTSFPVIKQTIKDRVFDVHPGGRLVLRHVYVRDGRAQELADPRGGGILGAYGSELTLERTHVLRNWARQGGGIFSEGAVTLIDSNVRSNAIVDATPDATSNGSGIAMERSIIGPAKLTMTRSSMTFNGQLSSVANVVPNTYALVLSDGATAQLENSTLAYNERGVWAYNGSQLDMRHVTIASNYGFGLRFDEGPGSELQLFVRHSVIADNEGIAECRSAGAMFLAPGLVQLDIADGSNASTDPSCGFSGVSDIALVDSPFLAGLHSADVGQYIVPDPTKGLVDAGDVACSSAEDQRELPRPINSLGLEQAHCDIGAVEYDALIDPAPSADIFSDGLED